MEPNSEVMLGAIRAFAEAHISFAETITEKYSIYDRSAHLMIPYDPQVEAANKSAAGLYNPKALLSKICLLYTSDAADE